MEGVLVRGRHGLKQALPMSSLRWRAERRESNLAEMPSEQAEESFRSGTRRVTEGVRGPHVW